MSNVAIISLSGKRPLFALAASTDNSLHILRVESPPASIEQLKLFIRSKQDGFKRNDVTLFVDDPSGLLNEFGYPCSLSGKNHDNTNVLAKSIERYIALNNTGSITLPENDHGFEIPESMMNMRTNDRGESYYLIDWQKFTDKSRILLLAIHCVYSQDLTHPNFITEMFSHLNNYIDEPKTELDIFTESLRNHRL